MSEARGSWSSWSEFLFSALGSVVGLGNIWRFPFICYRSGGGAFMIPYLVALTIIGAPMMLVETSSCQFSGLGPGRYWGVVCPLFQGLGLTTIIFASCVTVYYIAVVAWTVYYLGASFQSPLPWTTCDNSWNTDLCVERDWRGHNHSTNASSPANGSATPSALSASNVSVTPEEEYWFRQVLQRTDSIGDFGRVRWQLVLCLAASWVIVTVCLAKGIKSLGKVAYVASSLPYFFLAALLVRMCLLSGASDGIYYYVMPQWDKLLDIDVWKNAATQVIYSLGLSTGALSTLASYNIFRNNCFRDAILLPVLDGVTSVYAGLVVFACIGYMAHIWHLPVEKVVDQGPGLVFIAYPAALATLPLPQLWSVIFFIMLFTVGLNSQFVHVQILTAALADRFPEQLMHRRDKVTLVVCIGGFCLGCLLMSGCGVYIVNLMDWYFSGFTILAICLLELLGLCWIYGADRLCDDLAAMIGYRPHASLKIAWLFVTPAFIFVMWLSGMVAFRPIGSKYSGFPIWSDVLGYFMGLVPLSVTPIFMVVELSRHNGTFMQRLRKSTQPSTEWKPQKEHQGEEEMEHFCVKA